MSGDAEVRRRPELDALRGVAAVLILAFHAVGLYAQGSAQDATIRPWVARLEVGVPIFLLLSGYLLYRPWIVARRRREHLSARRYAGRRFLRIVPAYWVALTLGAILVSIPGVLELAGVRYDAFLQIYSSDTVSGGLPQGWTLCLEVSFYVFLPVWALIMRRVRGGLGAEAAGLAVLAVLSIAWQAIVLLTIAPEYVSATDPWLCTLPGYLDTFALGMLVAVANVAWEERGGPPAWVVRAPGLWWLAALAVFALAAVGAGLNHVDPRGYTHVQYATRHALYGLIALLLLIPSVTGGGLPERLLRGRVLTHTGQVSYGIYLYHLIALGILGNWGYAAWEGTVHPYLLWLTGALLGSYLLAELSWRVVERPALRLSRRWRPRG